jgi:hypothetical protein
MGLVREKVYLHDVKFSTCLVDAYEDYNSFGEVSFFFVMSKVSKGRKQRLSFE